MLQLDPDQLLSIERAVLAERAVQLLYASFPESAGALEADSFVQLALQQTIRAQSYGLTEGPHVFRFILGAWIFGPGFDEKIGTLRAVLQDATLSPEARAERLERAVLGALAALSHDKPAVSNEVGR